MALTLTANGTVFVRDVAFEEEVAMQLSSLVIVLVLILSSTAFTLRIVDFMSFMRDVRCPFILVSSSNTCARE